MFTTLTLSAVPQRVILGLGLLPLLLLAWTVKPLPLGAAVAILVLGAVAMRDPRASLLGPLLLGPALVLASATFWIALLLWSTPAVTSEGHGVMPIGQTFGGAILGVATGLALASRVFRAPRRAPGDERRAVALLALGLGAELVARLAMS